MTGFTELSVAGAAAQIFVDDAVDVVLALVEDSVSGSDFITLTNHYGGRSVQVRASVIVAIATRDS
jgi:hypothetical protein